MGPSARYATPMTKLVITYKDRPSLDGFSIKVPAGHYTREELASLLMFEHQWQCDEAPTRTIEIQLRPRYDTKP